MFDSSSFANPTPLAHADTSRDVLPRRGSSLPTPHPKEADNFSPSFPVGGSVPMLIPRSVQTASRILKWLVKGNYLKVRLRQSKDNPHDVVRSVRKGTESKLAITIILRLTRYWFSKSMNAFVVNDLKVNKNKSQVGG
ncbi:hypothetical protein TNCV_5119881 [Trichonephila clavipes]|nr:hypothetical protein TNCV_5119881 [Trichonephila clavipes]